MKLYVNGYIVDKYSNLAVSLIYDSVCSTFSFDIYFDPYDAQHREIMLPGAYNQAQVISDDGETLLTGVLLSPSFRSSAVRSLVNVSGYSRTGVLDDCEYSAVFATTQTDKLSLYDIAQKCCDAFGLGLVMSDDVKTIAQAITAQSDADKNQTVAEYLSEMARDKNIVLSHDELGNLVLTQASDSKSIFDFTAGMPGYELELSFDGSAMHSFITAAIQGGISQTVTNPYVQQGQKILRTTSKNSTDLTDRPTKISYYNTGYRPHVITQTTGDNNNTKDAAQQALADEVKQIPLTVYMVGWELNHKIVRPNSYITVQNPELYLFNKIKFFIQRIDFSGDERQETAVLYCTVPEAFNGEVPINIFTNNGNNTNFKKESESPTYIPFTDFPKQPDL